jgi:sporulation protein YlmC with PRC-barrel domain
MGAASAAAIMAAAPAWADCTADLHDYDQTVTADNEYRVAMSSQMRGDLRQLRDSAFLLQRAGQEEACQEVVAAIKDMVENPEKTAEEVPAYEDWNAQEIERLKSAQSLDQLAGRMRAEEIIGSDIRNLKNEDLGEIDDILLATDENETSYAIVSHGGFLGLGEKQIAVPMRNLKVTEDKDVFVLDVTEEQLDNAPGFERGKFDEISDDAWRNKNDEYFGSL